MPKPRRRSIAKHETQRAVNPAASEDADPPTGTRSAHATPTIVGIGASAGGLDAFLRLLRHIPADTGSAYVLVQHLDPVHESVLPELLGRDAAIPVIQARDGIRIEANHAYVIPPNTTMTVTDGHLRLVTREGGRSVHLPVDAFFESLAEVHGSAAVGVILSGAGSDGARGIEAIKEAGGITMAQDEASAAYPSMPQSAAATGHIDFVLTPEGIAEQLVSLGRDLASYSEEEPGARARAETEDEAMRRIFVLLQRHTGVDFQHYRPATIHRRLLRRMLLHRQHTRKDYLAYLRLNPAELDALYEELLIRVTNFFRDPEVFAYLQSEGFAQLMAGHAPNTPIRIWVAGCAGGEEAYSLAIALLEFLEDRDPDVTIQIFGTDLSDASVAKARAGVYPESISADVSPERLRRFFVKDGTGYRISKAVRDLCVFSRQNIVRDPPFSHLGLVSCRNVLIYLEPSLQRRVFATFHYALEPHGLLVLGITESTGLASEFLLPVNNHLRVYTRRNGVARLHDVDFRGPDSPVVERRGISRSLAPEPVTDHIQAGADRLVLTRHAPPGVVINDQFEILRFRGDTSAFLAHAPGAPSLQLLKLARPELVRPIQVAVGLARVERKSVREGPAALVDGGVTSHVAIEVIPFQPGPAGVGLFVVLFAQEHRTPIHVPATSDAGAPDAQTRRPRKGKEGRELSALREHILAQERQLLAIQQEHEAALEALRAANEEIQSSNEELHSINEELETTKEEVQSTNEELTTLNEELRHRNREQLGISSDLSNILASSTIPIVIVGSDLRLRRFTPASDRVMSVIPSDVGRLLTDIKLRVPLPDLEQRIRAAIETLTVGEQEVRDDDGHWWSVAIRPYLTVDRVVGGAVLVFTDIDASKRYGERAQEVAEARRELLVVSEEARTSADRARANAEIANKAKSDFLTGMSHDLRTPLNAIAGYIQLLELGIHGPVTDAQRTDFTRIERSAQHLLSLINDILNFVKIEAGRLEYRIADVPLPEMILELEEMIVPLAAAKSLSVHRIDCDTIVRADPERLRQILLNLLSNALKFTPSEGQIGIRCSVRGELVRIEVWDTGVGIAPDHLVRIFEPFVQLGRGLTAPSLGGVGLGLTISRDLARAMGGDLTVTSVLGEGSTFTLTLPGAGPR